MSPQELQMYRFSPRPYLQKTRRLIKDILCETRCVGFIWKTLLASQVREPPRDLADLRGGTGESENLFIILSGGGSKAFSRPAICLPRILPLWWNYLLWSHLKAGVLMRRRGEWMKVLREETIALLLAMPSTLCFPFHPFFSDFK